MAHLREGQVEVDRDSNSNVFGPSGKRKRKATSCYLFVGGSSDTYKVTISTEGAHFCIDFAGDPCKGNTFGKARKYGSVHARDRQDPSQWCKHVAAAMADTEAVAEAQEITAEAFGEPPTVKFKVAEPVPAFEEPAPVEPTPVSDARERLAEIEAEAATLRAEVREGEVRELRDAIRPLVERFGYNAVKEAAKAAA